MGFTGYYQVFSLDLSEFYQVLPISIDLTVQSQGRDKTLCIRWKALFLAIWGGKASFFGPGSVAIYFTDSKLAPDACDSGNPGYPAIFGTLGAARARFSVVFARNFLFFSKLFSAPSSFLGTEKKTRRRRTRPSCKTHKSQPDWFFKKFDFRSLKSPSYSFGKKNEHRLGRFFGKRLGGRRPSCNTRLSLRTPILKFDWSSYLDDAQLNSSRKGPFSWRFELVWSSRIGKKRNQRVLSAASTGSCCHWKGLCLCIGWSFRTT